MSLRSFAILLLAISFAACASAPPAAPPASEAPKAETPRTVELLCGEGARYVSFDKLGIPSQEYPTDVALTRGSTWVLFPQRLMQLSRGGEHLDVRMHVAPPDEQWVKIDVDPVDESIWIASATTLALRRVTPDGHMSTVKLQRKVEGTGGYSGLVVGRDALYAQPTCAEFAVWRLDRSGKLLGTALEAPKKTEGDERPQVLRTDEPESKCNPVRLERDAEGRILAWDPVAKATWQVDDQGAWTPSDSHLFAAVGEPSASLPLKAINIGERTEQWYFGNGPGSLFFWRGKPVFVGSRTMKEKMRGSDTVLLVPEGESTTEFIMPCHGAFVLDVATDATSYAAVTDGFLVLGDLAGAPDLP
jgi:hypothetical protein